MARDSHHYPLSAQQPHSQHPDRSVFPSISNFRRGRLCTKESDGATNHPLPWERARSLKKRSGSHYLPQFRPKVSPRGRGFRSGPQLYVQKPVRRNGGQELEDCEYLHFLARRKNQNISFNPSCITRLLPEPTAELPAATSGVAPPLT